MTISAAQAREACALLRWKTSKLCKRAMISYKAALNARLDEGISALSDADLQAILKAFKVAGVEFNMENDSAKLRDPDA